MSRCSMGSLGIVLLAVLGLGCGLSGCQKKESPEPAASDTTSPQGTAQEDVVLERMRREVMTGDRPAGRSDKPATQPTASAPDDGFTPKELLDAAAQGNLEKVKKLMMQGGFVLLADLDGTTPLHWAAYGGHLDVVKFLVEEVKMGPGEPNNLLVTPVHWAAVMGHRDVVDYLVSNGAAIDARDNAGRSPLFAAASSGQLDVVDYLLQNGADVNAADARGRTPLNEAMMRGQAEVVKMLIDHGAKQTPMTTQAS
jgi:ankyrin repeat protein